MTDDQLTINERQLAEDFLRQALDSLFEIGRQHADPPQAKLKAGQDTKAIAVAVVANRQRILGERLSAARTADPAGAATTRGRPLLSGNIDRPEADRRPPLRKPRRDWDSLRRVNLI
jgi:hypothetical protein